MSMGMGMPTGASTVSTAPPQSVSMDRVITDSLESSAVLVGRIERALTAIEGPKPATAGEKEQPMSSLIEGAARTRNNLMRAHELLCQLEAALGLVPSPVG